MENALLKIVDDVVENEGFVIDSDSKAEWSLNKIREEQAELNRMVMVCESMIQQYKAKIEKANQEFETKTSYIKNQLQRYFETVPKKSTKTQETYSLPSGKLIKKFPAPEIVKDESKLLDFVKSNAISYIKVKESVDWAEFKKVLTPKDNMMITPDGEIVEGVTLVQRGSEFKVEV